MSESVDSLAAPLLRCRRTVEDDPNNGTDVSATVADTVRGHIPGRCSTLGRPYGWCCCSYQPSRDIIRPLFDVLSSAPTSTTKRP